MNANATLGNLIFRNISELRISPIGIETDPINGAKKTENIPITNNVVIIGFLFCNNIFLLILMVN